jgi:hypothetical protein
MKRARQQHMPWADLLAFFESSYYKQLPAGQVRRLLATLGHYSSHLRRWFK